MKIKTLLLTGLSIFCFTLSCTYKADSETEKSDVEKIVKEFYRSFEQEDINLMSELMAHDESMLSFGTSISDLHRSWSEWKENHVAQFNAIDEAKINSKNLHVYLSRYGNVAWFADLSDWTLVIQNETIQMNDIRITGVLEKRDDVWKIVQIHASVPQD
jgi:ketosteroid isomerase-like protein